MGAYIASDIALCDKVWPCETMYYSNHFVWHHTSSPRLYLLPHNMTVLVTNLLYSERNDSVKSYVE